MKYLYLDFETTLSKTVTLNKMTLRQYLAACSILGMSVALDDEDPTWFTPASPEWADVIDQLRACAQDDDCTFVAHNAAFELRVLMHKLDVPPPMHLHCTMEASMCAFPNQPGGYGLDNLAKTLNLGGAKTGKGDEVMGMTPQELEAYCNQDVNLCRALHRICLRRVPTHEWAIAELCNRIRECYLEIDTDAVAQAAVGFTAQADRHAQTLSTILDDEDMTAFGREHDGHARSVRTKQVRALLLDNLGFDTHTISKKKLNPVALAQNQDAAKAIDAAAKANKALSNKRKVSVFRGRPVVDMELGFYRAHTGRFSSPGVGKGLNLHNLSKHDKEVAKLYRSMFKLPDHLCFVRADEANVEYRVSGLLAGSNYIDHLFTADIFSDPYSAFGAMVLGYKIAKSDPIRQVFKMAVLGLSYGMGPELWTKELLKELAKPGTPLTLDTMRDLATKNGWSFPPGKFARSILTKTGCDPVVVAVAYHTREAFHRVHPEFGKLARWLFTLCEEVSRCADPADAVERWYTMPDAPNRELLDCIYTDEFEGRSIKVRCGPWPSTTVVWRDIGVREVPLRGVCLSTMSGNKGYRALLPSTCIQNCVQSAARNGTCQGKLKLAGAYPYILSVHDEILPIVPKDRASVLGARHALLDTFGPGKLDGWKWSIVISPDEINVSQTLYEVDMGVLLGPNGVDEKGKPTYPKNLEWWRRLEAGEDDLLLTLP